MVIYMATNNTNNKSYIGKTIFELSHRKWEHINDAKKTANTTIYFHKAINKYGKNSFKWHVLWKGICDDVWLNELEKYYIYFYDTFNNGYNMTEGGDGAASGKNNSFCKLSPKRRMEIILKGNEKRRKFRHSEETLNKMSETRSKMYKGRNNPMSKIYKLISPFDETFVVQDGLERFCSNMGISFTMIRKSLRNNSIIEKTTKNRSTKQAQNTIGWRAIECQ